MTKSNQTTKSNQKQSSKAPHNCEGSKTTKSKASSNKRVADCSDCK